MLINLSAAASTNAVTIDPTLLALIPVATALMAIIAGVVGAWMQSRREHSRWVRERRYEAYTELDEALGRVHVQQAVAEAQSEGHFLGDEPFLTQDSVRTFMDELPGALARVNLLGPKYVIEAKSAWLATNLSDKQAQDAAVAKLRRAMRRALRIRV